MKKSSCAMATQRAAAARGSARLLCPLPQRSSYRAKQLPTPGGRLFLASPPPSSSVAAAAAATSEPFFSTSTGSSSGVLTSQSFAAMDPFGGPPLSPPSSSLFPSLQQQLQEMDRSFDAVFQDVDRMQRAMDAELAAGLRRLQEQDGGPAVNIERREERGPGSYRFYESIQIRSGAGSYAPLTRATTDVPGFLFSPLLFAALLLAGAWAAVTAAFNRNFHLTPYAEASRWRLLATWPMLALTSRRFAAQLGAALRGERLRVTESMDGSGVTADAAADAALLSTSALPSEVQAAAAAAAVVEQEQEQQVPLSAQPHDTQQQPQQQPQLQRGPHTNNST